MRLLQLSQALLIVTIMAQTALAFPVGRVPAVETDDRKPVAVGEMAPEFTLKDTDGNEVSLSAVRAKSPTVLVFYRGYW